MPEPFFVVGPTAVGKSTLAINVAEELGAEIVNADAFQVYCGLDILSAKPDAVMRGRVPHHLLSTVPLTDEMSAARFREIAINAIERVRARGKVAMVVGGSGLYVKALTRGFDETGPPNATLRAELNELSLKELAARLQQLDSQRAARTDLKNQRRVVRAIEIALGNSVVPTARQAVAERRPVCPQGQQGLPPGARGVFLVRDRDDLYARINERVCAMFRDGVEKEVAALEQIGPTASQALGLREIQQLLARDLSRKDCVARIQQATRRYAKRQLTWFRHQTNFPQLNLTALSHREAVSAIVQLIAQE
jgi:tRNA dimethylallyltransferase